MFFLNHKTTQTKRKKLNQQQQKLSKIKIEKNEYIKVYIMLIKFDFLCVWLVSHPLIDNNMKNERKSKLNIYIYLFVSL